MENKSQETKSDDYMTTREASYYLKLSVTTLTTKARQGKLRAIKSGRGYLFPRSEIERYARSVAGKALTDPTRGQDL